MKVLIAGMGLIGGSFALALRDRGIADEILGVESSEGNAAEALRLGLADRIVDHVHYSLLRDEWLRQRDH